MLRVKHVAGSKQGAQCAAVIAASKWQRGKVSREL